MPTQEVLDQKALDYGVLVAGCERKKLELETLDKSIATAVESRNQLQREIGDAQAAIVRYRDDLSAIEKEIADKRKQAQEEVHAERLVLDAQRTDITERAKQCEKIEKELQRRQEALEGRERNTQNAEKNMEARERTCLQQLAAADAERKEVHGYLTQAQALKNEAEKMRADAAENLRVAKEAEQSALAARDNARVAQHTTDDLLSDIRVAQKAAEDERATVTRLLDQAKRFCALAAEDMAFIREHVKNPDSIAAFYATKYPDLKSTLIP